MRFICPSNEFTIVPFQEMTCEIPSVFIANTKSIFGYEFQATDFQIHVLVFSLFTSFISPFGGFFGSGLKRALKVKDFGESIPGHGGITDRMDCQILTVQTKLCLKILESFCLHLLQSICFGQS
jgi:phosphatidate cytidylyltransferase